MTQTLAHDAILLYRDCASQARTHFELPFGKPGRKLKKSVYGEKFLYREVSVLSGDTRLRKLGPLGSQVAEDADAIFQAVSWMPAACSRLRELGYYGAARQLEEPMIDCFNLGLFSSGAVLIGQLAYLFWLNELGARATERSAAAPDMELALHGDLALDAHQAAYLARCLAAKNARLHVRFELEDYARYLDKLVQLPYQVLMKRECFMSNLNYLTCGTEAAVALVGDYLVPIRLPAPGRVYWQKLYWSRLPDHPRAEAERMEALVLGEALQRSRPREIAAAREALPFHWARQIAGDAKIQALFARRHSLPSRQANAMPR